MTDGSSLALVDNTPNRVLVPRIPSEDQAKVIWSLAQHASKSGIAKQTNPEAAFYVMMLGYELGLAPVTSLRLIYQFGSGAPAPTAQGMLALIRGSGKAKILKIPSAEEIAKAGKCVIESTRTDGASYVAVFALEEAKTAGLMTNGVWTKYPTDMMFARAVSRLARHLYSDVIGGLTHSVEEIYEATDYDPQTGEFSGNIKPKDFVDGKVVEDSSPKQLPPATKPPAATEEIGSEVEETAEKKDDSGEYTHPIFPKGDEIAKKKLVDFWTKEGFIKTSKADEWNTTLEEVRAMTGKPFKTYGELVGFESPEAFFEAMSAFLEQTAKKQPPAKPKASTKPHVWNDAEVFNETGWMSYNFGMTPEMQDTGKKEVTDFASPDAFRSEIIQTAITNRWNVIAKQVEYNGKGKPMVFQTALGNILWYEGRTALKKLLSDKYDGREFDAYEIAGFNQLEDAKDGSSFELSNIVRIKWEIKGEQGREYMSVIDIDVDEEIPF